MPSLADVLITVCPSFDTRPKGMPAYVTDAPEAIVQSLRDEIHTSGRTALTAC